jgi:hypothetical protein
LKIKPREKLLPGSNIMAISNYLKKDKLQFEAIKSLSSERISNLAGETLNNGKNYPKTQTRIYI